MFLQLAHTRLDIFQVSKTFVLECYMVTKLFPPEERFASVQQIRRAALSVHLNIAEGCSGKSIPERRRFFEVSRGSLIEIDTALEFCSSNDLEILGEKLIRAFKILCGD